MLEEVTRHDIEAHDWQHHNQQAQTSCRCLDKGGSIARAILANEHPNHLIWEYLADQKAEGCDTRCPAYGHPEGACHTVVLPCAIVIAHNRLHTLR